MNIILTLITPIRCMERIFDSLKFRPNQSCVTNEFQLGNAIRNLAVKWNQRIVDWLATDINSCVAANWQWILSVAMNNIKHILNAIDVDEWRRPLLTVCLGVWWGGGGRRRRKRRCDVQSITAPTSSTIENYQNASKVNFLSVFGYSERWSIQLISSSSSTSAPVLNHHLKIHNWNSISCY